MVVNMFKPRPRHLNKAVPPSNTHAYGECGREFDEPDEVIKGTSIEPHCPFCHEIIDLEWYGYDGKPVSDGKP